MNPTIKRLIWNVKAVGIWLPPENPPINMVVIDLEKREGRIWGGLENSYILIENEELLTHRQ